jgi:hypothetical protein
MGAFGKLLRFKTPSGQVCYGEARGLAQITKDSLMGAEVPIFNGGDPWSEDFKLSGRKEKVAEVWRATEYTKD